MTCSAVVLICPVKDGAGRIFFFFFLPALNSLQVFLPGSRLLIQRFYEARVAEVVGEPSLPLINSSRLLRLCHAGGKKKRGGVGVGVWGGAAK